MSPRMFIAAAVATLGTPVAVPAHAGLLGDSVTLEYAYSASNSFPVGVSGAILQGPLTVTIGSGVEWSNVIGTIDVDVTDAGVTITDFRTGAPFETGAFNGVILTDFKDSHGNALQLSHVSLASSSWGTFNAGDVAFDSQSIGVNFQSQPVISGETVTISFTAGPSDVPEPSSIALLGTGLLGLGRIVRRRRA